MHSINVLDHYWYAYCVDCDRRYVVHDHKSITDPDQEDEFELVCACGAMVSGWDEGA